MPPPMRETGRLILRPLRDDDAERLRQLADDPEIARNTLRIPHPYTREDAEAFLADQARRFREGAEIAWAVTLADTEELVGVTGLRVEGDEAELGYWIGRPFWGRGYATEAAREALAHGFDELGLVRIHACHFPWNPASGRVLGKLGMARVGVRWQPCGDSEEPRELVEYEVVRDVWAEQRSSGGSDPAVEGAPEAETQEVAEGQRATLGGGCFWCLEPVFSMLRGVRSVVCGYAGGDVPSPTYREVCAGETGHAEVVQVTYDPRTIGFRDLLEVFFAAHDPTTPGRQGPDVGSQYRSVILTSSVAQREVAKAVIAELEVAKVFDAPIVTEVRPLTAFYRAEAYHQGYYERNGAAPYCAVMIAPKVARIRDRFPHLLRA